MHTVPRDVNDHTPGVDKTGSSPHTRTMPESNAMFLGLVASLHSTGMVQLGKIANPITGKAERDLDAVRQTIDLLEMLQVKSRGNLSEEEVRFIEHALYELRMNYIEETRNPSTAVTDKNAETPPQNPAN